MADKEDEENFAIAVRLEPLLPREFDGDARGLRRRSLKRCKPILLSIIFKKDLAESSGEIEFVAASRYTYII